MVNLLQSSAAENDAPAAHLMDPDEIIIIVDDSPEITLLLSSYLSRQQLPHVKASCAFELYQLLEQHKVALILLDIGLPDEQGTEVLKKIAPGNPDLGIIMVTGSMDLQTALECLREGADDYLTKPVSHQKFNHTINQTLHKRRMAIDNRLFQKRLEETHFRTQFLHQLNLKMNSAYLSPLEVQGMLQAILVGITSEEGLKFNRAFLALFDEDHATLHGRLAIGPARREDATRVWNDIKDKNISLGRIIDNIVAGHVEPDVEINNIVQQIKIASTFTEHVLIGASEKRKSIHVQHGVSEEYVVQKELIELLDEDSFVITPLYSPSKSLGVIIADNFITRKPISKTDIDALEIFANQASLAIEHSQLYRAMQVKINELELTTQELDRSKDLLIEADRLATLGHMSAQIVHAIRNPITALGGTARLLDKKLNDPISKKFLQVIIKEASKVESTLEDLFNYVDESELHLATHPVNDLLRKSVMVFYTQMQRKNIDCKLNLTESDPVAIFDAQKLRQVFHHLIKNGLESMENGGELYISSKNREDTIEITIRDSGSGVDANALHKISDAFYTTKTYGTGMGLTLVEQIIKLHNGTFSLTNNESAGMCATIILNK